jgi:hypothetical protein
LLDTPRPEHLETVASSADPHDFSFDGVIGGRPDNDPGYDRLDQGFLVLVRCRRRGPEFLHLSYQVHELGDVSWVERHRRASSAFPFKPALGLLEAQEGLFQLALKTRLHETVLWVYGVKPPPSLLDVVFEPRELAPPGRLALLPFSVAFLDDRPGGLEINGLQPG